MKNKVMTLVIPAAALLLATGAPSYGQSLTQRALDRCRDEVVSQLRVGRGNVTVEPARADRSDNLIVRFDVQRGNVRREGYCAVTKDIQIANFQVRDQNQNASNSQWDLPAQNQQAGGSWGQPSGSWNQSGQRPGWGGYDNSQIDRRPAVTNFHRVKVDTSGRGNFSGGFEGNAEITRGWVDTRSGRISVGVSGKNNFKATFYGDIVESNDQRMVMRITDSDRGQATGRVEFQLNRDRNEVEWINLSGRMGRNQFTGSFRR
jgi:hypothetical protein